ncbi:MAG: PH domain-containing protein [Nanobdellota archaeon]
MEFKPNRKAFLIYPFIRGALIWFLILTILSTAFLLVIGPLAYLLGFILFILITSFSWYSSRVVYDKLTYTFTENKIIAKGGTIFSDFESELTVRNITNVRKVLPFLQHYFYKTGDIFIDSAGSGDSQIGMFAMDAPEEVFQQVQRLMHKNGFSMKGETLKLERSPHSLAVLLQVAGMFIGTGGAFLSIFGVPALAFIAALIGGEIPYKVPITIALIVVSILVFIGFLVAFYIRYAELKRRTYRIFDDMITYYEGFLTKVAAVVPMENLSDTSLKQTFVDKLLNLSDVTVSSQGTGQEIHFRNIKDGKGMSEVIDAASSEFRTLAGSKVKEHASASAQSKAQSKAKATPQSKKQSKEKPKDQRTFENQYTASLQMDIKRTIMPLIPFCIFPPLIIVLVGLLIRASITKYYIKKESLVMEVSLFSTNTVEFSADKVTGVVASRGLIDRFFDTMTLQFWSIGSGQNIVFSNIKKDSIDLQKILAKVGIPQSELIYTIQPRFSLGDHIKRYPSLLITVGVFLLIAASLLVGFSFIPGAQVVLSVILIGIILIITLSFVVGIVITSKQVANSIARFHKDYLYYQYGWLGRRHFYAHYDNIKDITTRRYPFSNKGDITFNVAGETVIASSQGRQTMISSSFTVPFVPDIRRMDELIDTILYERPTAKNLNENPKAELVLEAKPALANPVVGLLTVSIIVFPLLIFLPITLPLTIIGVKKKTYRIENFRVLEQKGILSRTQTSIIFSKIDHINTSREMFNKLFGNGNITVNTTGSSSPELIIRNIPNYQQFYDELNRYYG